MVLLESKTAVRMLDGLVGLWLLCMVPVDESSMEYGKQSSREKEGGTLMHEL